MGIIRIQNSEYRIQNVSVYDIYGREVLKQKVGSVILSGVEGKQTEVDLSQQPKGIYIIKVQTKKGIAIEKVIVE